MLKNLKSSLFIFLLLFFSSISLVTGFFFVPQPAEGLWSLTWKQVEGQWVEGENVYRFSLKDSEGLSREYTGSRISIWRGGRNHRDIEDLFEKAVDRSLWRGRILTVHVHPLHPERSVLRAGVPPQTTLLFLLSLAVFAPTIILWGQWLQRGEKSLRARETMMWSLGAAFFYLLSFIPAMGFIGLNTHLLRTMPPSWPLWLFMAISIPLWLRPAWARLLYGFGLVRRLLYLVVLGFVLPIFMAAIGLGFPFILGSALLLVLLVLLLSPLAGPKTIALPGILLSLLWVPVYLCGLLAPCRALILYIHSALPYFPYYIDLPHLADPRNIAIFDTLIAGSGIIVTLALTALDTAWRHAQVKQVENLPTSKARSAAMGLAEFYGTARKRGKGEENGSGAIISHDSLKGIHLEPFFLEDESGRVLVDPRGIKLRTGWAGSFGGRICEAVLTGRVEKARIDRPQRIRLLDGDSVYLVGNVQKDDETGERVVKPLIEKRFSSPLWRLLYGDAEPLPQRDIQHIFFLSDSTEEKAGRLIRRGLGQVWLLAVLWFISSLWMLSYQQPRTQQGYDNWTIREIARYTPPEIGVPRLINYLDRDPSEIGTNHDLISKVPVIGKYFAEIEANLISALRTEVFNDLWGFKPPEDRADYLKLYLAALTSENASLRIIAVNKLGEFIPFAKQVVPALAEALSDGNEMVRMGSARNLAHFGPEAASAVPALIGTLTSGDQELRKVALFALNSLPLSKEMTLTLFSKYHEHRDVEVRKGIARLVGRLGPEGAPVINGLRSMLRSSDGYVRQSAIIALGEIGPFARGAVDELVGCLRDDTYGTRQFTATALGKIGPGARAAVPALVQLIADKNQWVRMEAIRALGKIGAEEEELAEPLGFLLSDRDAATRSYAVNALKNLGENALPALPELTEALAGDHRDTAREAAKLIGMFGLKGKDAVPSLLRALQSTDIELRLQVIKALGNIGPPAGDAVELLLTIVNESNERDRLHQAALEALRQIRDTERRQAALKVLAKNNLSNIDIEPLRLLLTDYDRDVRRVTAQRVAFGLGKKALPLLPELLVLLEDPYDYARANGVVAIGKIGTEAMGAIPQLISMLDDGQRDVRRSAIYALGEMGPFAAGAVEGIVNNSADADPYIRVAVADALEKITVSPERAVPLLRKMLEDSSTPCRQAAASALKSYGVGAVPALRELIGAVNDPDSLVRERALTAIGAIGPEASPAVGVVMIALEREDLRYNALLALRGIGPGARAALDRLRRMRADNHPPYLQTALNEAIREIEKR